jgi:hypothetical protein
MDTINKRLNGFDKREKRQIDFFGFNLPVHVDTLSLPNKGHLEYRNLMSWIVIFDPESFE